MALTAVLLLGCEGGTILEGDPLQVPPEVAIDHTATTSQVHAGSSFRILARATEEQAGIAAMDVSMEGAIVGQFRRSFPDAPAVAVLDTSLIVAGSASGEIRVELRATGVGGVQSDPVAVTVTVLGADTTPPLVAVTSAVPDRAEADDSLTVSVRCHDPGEGGQLAWCGYLVRFIGPAGDTVTVARRDTVAGVDTASVRDVLPIAGFDLQDLPDTLSIEVHGHAIDAAGNCAASMSAEMSSGICLGSGAGVTAAFPDADPTRLTVVASRTIHRSWGGTIEDLVVDAGRGVVYGSVIDQNRIEILDYLIEPVDARLGSVMVGSQPAGITLDVTGDTLIVANSGGTSLSFVDLRTRAEHSRLETHNAVLYDLPAECGAAPMSWWTDFGDRPHRVAQDRDGILFYSTTAGGPIRMVENRTGYEAREANIMLWSDVIVPTTGRWAVTYVDSMKIEPEDAWSCTGPPPTIHIYDHVTGHPDQLISASASLDLFQEAITELGEKGSDILALEDSGWETGYWDVGADTRFGSSADGSTLAIGDGSRIWTWEASGQQPGLEDRVISWYLAIDDLGNNSELGGLTGLAVDGTGSEFTARSSGSVIYFNDLLRLHGSHTMAALEGDGGLARHPTEPWAFAATGDRSVLVLEASGHYRVLAELPLVENLVGPLRLSLPRPGDPGELLVRLHGLGESGDVITLPVWQGTLP